MIRSELDVIDHVVRGALNTALLNLQLLSAALGADERAAPLLERARAEIRRVAEQLLPAALEVIGLEMKPAPPFELRPLVQRALAQGEGLGRIVLTPGPSARATGDPDLLALGITHLARNALAATPEGGVAPRIAIESEPGAVAVVVTNACAGTAAPIAAGTGAGRRGRLGGLLAVERIARLHGGSLTHETTEGEVVARLRVPVLVEQAARS